MPKKPQTTGPLTPGVTAGPGVDVRRRQVVVGVGRVCAAGEVDVVDRGGERHRRLRVVELETCRARTKRGARRRVVVVGTVGGIS